MARNEDGEFELVLGNPQLLSVFLIVVILLGVFFSMGYIVGRNSASAGVAAAAQPAPSQKPIIVENPARAAAPDEEAAPPSAPAPTEKPSPSGIVKQAPVPQETRPEAAKPAEAPRPEAAAPGDEPAPGQSFLQVVATTRPDAEIIADTLMKKGFHTLVVPSPNPALFRVIVGPLKDAADMGDTRSRLEAVGFKNPIVRKY